MPLYSVPESSGEIWRWVTPGLKPFLLCIYSPSLQCKWSTVNLLLLCSQSARFQVILPFFFNVMAEIPVREENRFLKYPVSSLIASQWSINKNNWQCGASMNYFWVFLDKTARREKAYVYEHHKHLKFVLTQQQKEQLRGSAATFGFSQTSSLLSEWLS